jgi:hypothetical protein
MELGELSARYESAAAGEDAIGKDSTGGASYGTYQVATKVGTMNSFLEFCRTRYPEIHAALWPLRTDMLDRRGQFAAKWREIADPTDTGKGLETMLKEAEHRFILETHYLPALKQFPESTRVMVEGSPTLRQVLWSTAVQHRPSSVQMAFVSYCKFGRDKELIVRDIYTYRGTRLSKLTPKERNSVLNRYKDECARAIAMLKKEG